MLYAVGVAAWGQTPATGDADRIAPQTRAGTIELQRQQKATGLRPDAPNRVEAALEFIRGKLVVERVTQGVANFRVKLGGLTTGSGFAAGPEYFRPDLARERLRFRVSARGSIRRFLLADAELSGPSLAGDRLFFQLYSAYRNYPRIDYYGPGSGSDINGRSGYRLEDASFQGNAGVKPIQHLRIGGIGRYYLVNVGPGRDERFVPSERIFTEATTPGIRQQSDFVEAGGFAQYDWRDNPGGPRYGGNYLARWTRFTDLAGAGFSFNYLTLEAQQHIGFFSGRRVASLRARVDAAEALNGQRVPFYLQPRLGGSEDLRGFRPFRFRDNSSIVLNAEYRWEVFSGLDMALFGDAGRVYSDWRKINLRALDKSFGFGFRFNVRNDVFLRIDAGFSREGVQLWVKFNNVY